MKIMIDNQEKKPLEFVHPWVTEIEVKHLRYGDYMCQLSDGHIIPYSFERKANEGRKR